MAWEFTVAVFCVTAFFVGLFAAVYVAFAASARFNAQLLGRAYSVYPLHQIVFDGMLRRIAAAAIAARAEGTEQ